MTQDVDEPKFRAILHFDNETRILEPSGRKDDQDKPPMYLLDPDFLEQVSKVLRFGAEKYSEHNWRGGIKYSRLLGAAMRHLCSIIKGEDIDDESGLPHSAHLGCCVMFLSWMELHRPDLDDRYKPTSLDKD